MLSSVDLPLPEAPTIAIISPEPTTQIQALQRDDLEVGDLVDADEALADDPTGLGRMGPRAAARRRGRQVNDLGARRESVIRILVGWR